MSTQLTGELAKPCRELENEFGAVNVRIDNLNSVSTIFLEQLNQNNAQLLERILIVYKKGTFAVCVNPLFAERQLTPFDCHEEFCYFSSSVYLNYQPFRVNNGNIKGRRNNLRKDFLLDRASP